jgi:hypothetical protein
MDRNAIPVRTGRIFQAATHLLRFLDYPFRLPYLFGDKTSLPAIFILAPPRSGSTLLYQILTESFHNVHLTNVWNLFYSMPVVGSLLSDGLCGSHRTRFESFRGFVPGLCGEAEGMKFWLYWMGQGLQPDESRLKGKKLNKLKGLLSKRYGSDDKIWVSGYIGHIFSIDFLRNHWPNSVFIHLYRDMVSNTYSIYKLFPHEWFSLDPGGIQEMAENRYDEIARQVTRIHSIILDYYGKDLYSVSYEKLCESPRQTMDEITDFAGANDITLRRKNSVPERFDRHEVDASYNYHTQMLYQYLKNETSKYKGHKRRFFDRLMV